MITQAPRGTKDWFGKEIKLRNKIEEIARSIAYSFNFKEISTPAFEHTNLFERGVGEDTDVVQKEMYTFEDKGGRSITLKPEGTSPVIRAYLEHNMYSDPAPAKLFYFTQAFRYEKPASGRLRQHHQFGCELIGSYSPLAEMEVILLAYTLIRKLGIKDISLRINSIGQGDCRKNYTKALLEYLDPYRSKLCKTCNARMDRNPLRVLDCKIEGCKEIAKGAPVILDYLDEECKNHMEELKQLLNNAKINYIVDPYIVRGLDYYTKTVFEFVDSNGFTLCGGGRYDKLVNEIDEKQNIPAVGFGIGIERIIHFLENENIDLDVDTYPDVYIGIMGNNKGFAFNLANTLRRNGLCVEIDLMDRSIKSQMKYANKIGARYTTIIGDEEVKTNKIKLKNMMNSEQIEIDINDIMEVIANARC